MSPDVSVRRQPCRLEALTSRSSLDPLLWRCACGDLFTDPETAARHTAPAASGNREQAATQS